jgi:hypothetical protein
MIYVLCPDDNNAYGGIRKLYRHVDVLHGHGWPATILHKQPGFRCTWFDNNTPVTYADWTAIQPSDFLVVPEVYGPNITAMFPGVRKVIFNQNCYYTFKGIPLNLADTHMPYTHPDVAAAFVVSNDSQEYLRFVFPQLKVYRLRYSIDPEKFHAKVPKQNQIAFMPRKQNEDVTQVLNILKTRGALAGFALVPIHQKTEAEAAALMRSGRMFLSFGHPEGFGLPPAEAMACGCITIGYHGRGGREFLTAGLAYPIEVGDILGYARTVEFVIGLCRNDPGSLAAQSQKAAAFIHEHYSPANEVGDILAVWQRIHGKTECGWAKPTTS